MKISYRQLSFALILGTVGLGTVSLGIPAVSDVPRSGTLPPMQMSGQNTVHEIARTAMPAVVSISAVRQLDSLKAPSTHPDSGWFSGPGDNRPTPPRALGIGSGVIIRSEGIVLTNNHVVESAERVTVVFDEKHKTNAQVIGTDPKTDLAVLKIEGSKKNYPTINFGNSDQIREGDWAIAIGSPYGLNRSLSLGVISAKGRAQMGILDIEDFIQTDAAINPGSSGGPLLNVRGELVGINTAIFSQGGGNMGIGFAIPSKIAKEISDEIILNGRISRGWIGLMAQDLDPELAQFFKVSSDQGALISEVAPQGPAGQSDLRLGDVITQFNSQSIKGAGELKSKVGASRPGSRIPVQIVREGHPKIVTMTIREQPVAKSGVAAQLAGQLNRKKNSEAPSFGLAVDEIPTEIAKFLRIPSHQGTLVVGVSPGSPAFDAGIAPGDVILKANQRDIHGASEFQHIAKNLHGKKVVVLYVQRGPAEKVFVPLKSGTPG